jgi:hypothetical protein
MRPHDMEGLQARTFIYRDDSETGHSWGPSS